MEYGREKSCARNNDGNATQGTHSLFILLASTPDGLLAVIHLDSSLPGLMDYVQIIGCSVDGKGHIQDFERF